MASERRGDKSNFVFNSIFTAMGMCLLSVAGWIGLSVADIPAIKVEIQNINRVMGAQISDHETRIRKLEGAHR